MTERQEEQTALHALHLLDAHEERILQTEMRSDPRLREVVTELENAVSEIALLLPDQAPPEGSREQILNALKQHRRANVKPFVAPLRLLTSPWVAWAAAAAIAFMAFQSRHDQKDLGRQVADLRRTVTESQAEQAALKESNLALEKKFADSNAKASQLAADLDRLKQVNPISRMEAASLRSGVKRYDEVVALIIWDSEKQEGKIRIEKMPAVQSTKDYQLWVIDKKKPASPVSAGVVKVDARGSALLTFKPAEHVSEAAKFALSIEKQGGVTVKSADGPIIFTGP